MKTLIHIYICFFTAGLFFSCDKTEIPIPVACVESFSMLPDGTLQPQQTFKVGETVIFKACADAKQYVIWTGDKTHNFDLNHGGKDANSGVALDSKDGTYSYAYNKAGKYKVVFFATNTDVAGEKKQSMTTLDIVIVK